MLKSKESLFFREGGCQITKGYDHEGVKFSLSEDGNDIELLWRDTVLDVHLGGLCLLEEKRGRMALVRPTPEKFDVISSFKTTYGSGPAWAHPVIRDGILYIRRGKAIMAYDIGT